MNNRTPSIQHAMRCTSIFLCLVAVACVSLKTTAAAAAQSGPCSTTDTRQLDFWLGNWTGANPGPSSGGTSKVYLSLDKCLFIEHWENGQGHESDKMFAYSTDDKTWHGMFADNQGRIHIFVEGKVGPGSAEFRGSSWGPNGEAVLNRLTLTQKVPNRVEEKWEKSTDKGATWTAAYSADYVRANP